MNKNQEDKGSFNFDVKVEELSKRWGKSHYQMDAVFPSLLSLGLYKQAEK